jgi:branched-chain amino acid transport system permease protein
VWPEFEFSLWRGDPIISFTTDGLWFNVNMIDKAKIYYVLLGLVILFAVMAKNLMRTRVGRAWAAIRDRDIAAEVMGVAEAKAKTQAFAISSFYAGVAGALMGTVFGRLIPETWNLLLSIEFIAIILIGGAGTITGTLMGTVFVVMLPRVVEDFTVWLASQAESGGAFSSIADIVIATGSDDFGVISTAAAGPGLSIFQLNIALFGVLIIVFLIAEPLGLFGIWIRIRNYWKGWPFTY